MRKQNSNQGITLIVLVITIIVLLILAAVSISAIVGENGIVSKSKKAENDTIEGEEQEFVELAYSSVLVDATTKGMTDEEKREALEKELKNLAGDESVTVENNGDRTYIITFTETGNEYEIELNTPNDNLGYTQKDIDETLKYFTFDETTGVLTSKEEMIGPYTARTFPLKVAVFPKEINGVPVEGIESFEGLGLLAGSKELEKVIILAEIEMIGSWDYYDCTNLTSIELPDSVTSIGNYAFYKCTGLTSIELPDSVTSIGNYAFSGCKGLTNIEIPDGVTSIGNYAFSGCTGLTSVTIPSSVTSIGNYAFSGCKGLTNIEIPDGVTSIGNYAFNGCTGLTSVIIGSDVTSIGEYAFNGCKDLTNIEIPDSVTSIGDYAFKECKGLTSVTIGSGVISIGSNAFASCTGLTSVTIGSDVTSIGSNAFASCTGLTNIKVDEVNTTYDSRDNCNAIIEKATNTLIVGCKNTTIPSSVTSIGSNAFQGCKGLTSIEIPDSVTSIGSSAFYGCTGLTGVTVPSSVTSVGNTIFKGCMSLTSIKVDEGNTTYDSRDNCNAIIETATNTLIVGCKKTTIPSGVTSIGGSAFYECSGLTSITIPSSVTSIGSSAFYGCIGLGSVTIPSSVTSIGGNAFYRCSALKKVYFEQTTKPKFGSGCFYKSTGSKTTFYFKNSTVASAFTTSHYNSNYGTKSTDYSW